MLKGKAPSADAARLMDIDMVLHAEHGSNASSFAARVVAGTEADLHGAITAAVAALAGPAHGGAAENVMRMAQEIGDPSRAAEFVRRKRANKEPVMGFGHRVYRAEDPRARHMRAGVEQLSREMGQPKWYQILEALVRDRGWRSTPAWDPALERAAAARRAPRPPAPARPLRYARRPSPAARCGAACGARARTAPRACSWDCTLARSVPQFRAGRL